MKSKKLLSLISLILILLLCLTGCTSTSQNDNAVRDQAYDVVDRFLQAKCDYDGKALIASLPEAAVDAALTASHRDRDAWVQDICDDLEEFQLRQRWERVEVIAMADAGEDYAAQHQELTERYTTQYQLNPSAFYLVRILLHGLYPDGDDIQYTHEQEYIVVCIDGQWYVDYDSAVQNYLDLNIAGIPMDIPAVPFLLIVENIEEKFIMAHRFGDEIPQYFVPDVLNAELTAHGITYDQYHEAILQRGRDHRDQNAAAGISYQFDYHDTPVYLRCEDELPALKKIYRDRYGVDIIDAWTNTFAYTRTTAEGTTNHTLVLTTVKVGSRSYIDLTSLPWAESGLFSFDGIAK